MNDEQLDKLFASARGVKPDTSRAEYAFETRLLAHLRAQREQSVPWYAFAWKLMPTFAAIVVGLGIWTYTAANTTDLQSAIAGDRDDNTLAAYFTGESQ